MKLFYQRKIDGKWLEENVYGTNGERFFEKLLGLEKIEKPILKLLECLDIESTCNLIFNEENNLNNIEKQIIRNRFWEGLSLRECGIILDIPIISIWRMEQECLKKLKIELIRKDVYFSKIYSRIKYKILGKKEEEEERKKRMDEKKKKKLEKIEAEDKLECPSYVFLKRGVDGELQLEIPHEYQSEFQPVKTSTYKRWLKEMAEDPKLLEELLDDEMEFGEKEA